MGRARPRAAGLRVGFVGLAASKLPDLFDHHADFIVYGEPEEAVMRLARGRDAVGLRAEPRRSPTSTRLPFPRWDLVGVARAEAPAWRAVHPAPGRLPLLASRSCPEFCTYCPHRILSSYRSRSVENIVDELDELCDDYAASPS